jgi:hypothetical protein
MPQFEVLYQPPPGLSVLRESINQMNTNLTRLIDKIEQALEKQK